MVHTFRGLGFRGSTWRVGGEYTEYSYSYNPDNNPHYSPRTLQVGSWCFFVRLVVANVQVFTGLRFGA